MVAVTTEQSAAGSETAGEFVESLMDTDLYSMGAFFSDEHPDLVDEVVDRSSEIERTGLASYAAASGIDESAALLDSEDKGDVLGALVFLGGRHFDVWGRETRESQ